MKIIELIRMLQEEENKDKKIYIGFVDRYGVNEAKNIEYGEDNDGNEVIIIK